MRRILFSLLVLLLAVSCGTNANEPLRFLQSISVQPATATVAVGKTAAFTAMGTFSDGKVENLATDGWGVTWDVTGTMANPVNWATVDVNGVATCLNAPQTVQVEAHAVSLECKPGQVCPQIAVAMVTGSANLTCN
jgi:hypothetical protein